MRVLLDWQYASVKMMEKRRYCIIRNKKIYTTMKPTKIFIQTIADYLKTEGERDELFAKKMEEHPEKTPEAVCNYILAEVSKAKQCGYADEEIFSMAKHFIDEDELKDPGNKNNVSRMTVNHHVELSEEEKAKAMEAAERTYLANLEAKAKKEEEDKRIAEKVAAEKKRKAAEERREKESKMQMDLFGGM